MPNEIIAHKLSRTPTREALDNVCALLGKCFWPLDVRYQKVVRMIDYLRFSQGADAARHFLLLDRECQFFVRFALEIYGLQLAYLTI